MTDQLYDTPYDFYEQFSNEYYQRGYQHRSHKKEDLYRILDRFGRQRGSAASAEVRQLLRLDMADTLNPEAIKKFERKGWELLI